MQISSVETLADEIIKREGGYVNDPDDPGGATNYGVTLATLQHLGRDLNHDGTLDAQDVMALRPRDARDIYIDCYFLRPNLDLLPQALWPSTFDMHVNAGTQAIVILQKMLCSMGYAIAKDGKVGPQTAQACDQALAVDSELTCDAYAIERRNFYLALADRRPSLRKFARTRRGGKGGWVRRAEEFMRPKFHLSTEEFNTRTKDWT